MKLQKMNGALLLLVTFCALHAAAQGSTAWTGTWAAAPVYDGSGKSFQQQTFRQILHTSIGGHAARIHISNVFGKAPVTLKDVHIALRSHESSIVSGTDRQVYFAGADSVIIQPGNAAVSDAIQFDVPTLADVAISFYLPEPAKLATMHPAGLQTNYVAEGDVSGKESMVNATTDQSYYFLTNLDVGNSVAFGSVVTLGASITDGFSSNADANRRWPNDLAQRLVTAGIPVGVLNQGISGNRLLEPGAGESAETRFDRDVLQQPGVRWVIFSDDPINDLGGAKGTLSSGPLIAAMKRIIVRAHEYHIQFFCSTLTPFEGANYWTESAEVAREQINAFIRSRESGCDAVIDQDTATHDPARQSRYLPAFDIGDHLHPNTAGLQAIANAVDLKLFQAHPRDGYGKKVRASDARR